MTKLILASSSPARQKLLQQLRLPFSVVSPNIDESPHPDEAVSQLVIRLAKEKALTVASKHSNAIIIAADSVGTLGQAVLGKPLSHENAVKQLQACSGKNMIFYTGLCVYDPQRKQSFTHLSQLDVYFKLLSDDMIAGYLKRDQPYQCAGSIKMEELGIALIDKIVGDDYTAIIGLPLMKLTSFLHAVGLDPLS